MDGEDLIICVAIWTLYKRWVPLLSGDFRAVSMVSRNRLRSASLWEAILEDFERFWEAKMDAKIDFLDVFFEVFFGRIFGIDFEWIFGGSKLEKSINTIVFPMVFTKFHKNGVFEKVAKKRRFWLRLRNSKRRHIEKK